MWVVLVVIKVTMQATSAGWIVNLPVFEVMCSVLRCQYHSGGQVNKTKNCQSIQFCIFFYQIIAHKIPTISTDEFGTLSHLQQKRTFRIQVSCQRRNAFTVYVFSKCCTDDVKRIKTICFHLAWKSVVKEEDVNVRLQLSVKKMSKQFTL